MPVHNNDVADIFNTTADLLELKGENQYRIRAYRMAARTIGGLSQNVAEMVNEGKDLSELSGIGKDLAQKIKKIVKTGKFALLEKIKHSVPVELSKLMQVSGLGAKRVKAIYDELDIKSLDQLEKAAKDKKISDLEGFGSKTEKNILESIKEVKEEKGRIKLAIAEQYTNPLIDYLKRDKSVKDIEIAGSNRRKKETVKDADILVTCKKSSNIMDKFTKYEDVKKVLSKGKTKSSVILKSGFQIDLRVVPKVSYGSALIYFTGSKAHNINIRKIAVKKKLKINEYGIFKGKNRKAGKTEAEVYKKIGLRYVEPELREDRGEIDAAKENKLPKLITLEDIRGDLHTHTKLTDGHYTLKEMAQAAEDLGYEYIANTEHSKHVTVAKGLDSKKLARQIRNIDKLNKKLKKIVILKSIEVDILEDGKLDLGDDMLKELDFTVCSIHYKFNLSEKKQTERILRAMDNRYFTILGHPTGRMINERPPYEIDMERIMKEARSRGCIMELDAHPERLDLNDAHCKAAKDIGVKIAISTDSHTTDDLKLMRFGINQARRGWLEAGDVVNTRGLKRLKKLFKRK